MMKKAKLLWIDLEMTGLDPVKDKILEVAAIATNMRLKDVARYEAVVKVPEKLMKERMVKFPIDLPPYVRQLAYQ